MKKLLYLFLLLSFFSCANEETNISYKPNSIGTQGKIDVIINDKLWEGRLGEIIKDKLAPMILYYPNEEYLFDLAQHNRREFQLGTKKQKNIIFFEINLNEEIKNTVRYSSDVWANDQAIVKIIGKTQQDLYDLFIDNSQEIQDYFMELEITRMKVFLLQNKNHLAEKNLLLKHHLSLTVPNDMTLSISKTDFAAFEKKRLVSQRNTSAGDVQQFIYIHHFPYTDKSQLTKPYLLAKRDSIVKKYFRGVNENSYMRTIPDSLAPSFEKERIMKGNYTFEIRGLYGMVNDSRGGPFINISMVDEKRNRIIMIEGHVFAPKFEKRPYMMELETMINTLFLK